MWINNELFKIKTGDIPKVPIEYSEESRAWWAEFKKRCIEGYSVGGKWMPPNLYFYINEGVILLNKTEKSKTKIPSKPFLRDIEWEVFTAWSVARGLSGFLGYGSLGETGEDILYKIRNDSLANIGTPVYENEAKDLLLMGPREFGKSYIAGIGVVLHEWLFDGEKEYIPGKSKEKIIVEGEVENDFSVTNIVVGAGDSSYAKDLISKTKLGYDFMAKKGIMFNGKFYPHPFFKKYTGSFSKEVVAKYKKKIGGNWLDYGTNSKIRIESYKDDPYAGQGTRNSVMVKEEIGMFKGLIKAQEADLETMKQGTMKFGSCLYIGTGGAMEGGTLDAYRMFFDPTTYDLLEFTDTWEAKGKIAMFISATKRANQFKDENGNTNEEEATAHFIKERERLRNSKNGTQALSAHIQYNPLVPSEVFLRSSGNIFPTTEIKEHLAELETNSLYRDAEMICELIFNSGGKVEPRLDNSLEPIREFPMSGKSNQDTSGSIVIWHHPELDGN